MAILLIAVMILPSALSCASPDVSAKPVAPRRASRFPVPCFSRSCRPSSLPSQRPLGLSQSQRRPVTPTHPTLTRATAPASVPAYAPSQVGRASRRSSTHQTGLHRRLVLNMPRLLRRHRLHVPPQLVHLPPSQPVASTLLRMPCDAEPPCTPDPPRPRSQASLSSQD
jgi:hypothetical protein